MTDSLLAPPLTRVVPGAGHLDEPNRLHGYAARFGEPSAVLHDASVLADDDGKALPFVEVIAPGAFARTLRESPDVRALYNHDRNHVLARTVAGTLKLFEDEVGLGYSLTLPDTQVARDLRESIRRGDIDGCSFMGFVVADEVGPGPDGGPALRTVTEIELIEITPACAFPAYASTSVFLRSRPAAPGTPKAAPAAADDPGDAGPTPTPALHHAAARLRLSRP